MNTSNKHYNFEIYIHHYGYMIMPDEFKVEYRITNTNVHSKDYPWYPDTLELYNYDVPDEYQDIANELYKFSLKIGKNNVETSVDLPHDVAEKILEKTHNYSKWETLDGILDRFDWDYIEIPWYSKNAILWGEKTNLEMWENNKDRLKTCLDGSVEINIHTLSVFDRYRFVKCRDIMEEDLEKVRFRHIPRFILETNGNNQ